MKLKLKTVLEFGNILGVGQKLALGEADLIESNFTNFRAKVWKILIFEWIFVVGN